MADERFWRKNARRYDRSIHLLNRRFPQMVDMVVQDLGQCGEVLEIAAGTGLVSLPLARAVPNLVVTDLSSEMLAIARGRLNEGGLTQVESRQADALNLEFPDASFDGLVAANILHLLPDVDRALAEWKRVLRPGGLLCVPTFLHAQTLTAQAVSRVLGLVGFPIVTRFRANDLVRVVQRHGFSVERTAVIPGPLPLIHLLGRATGSMSDAPAPQKSDPPRL
ncbi:MAG TPA: methyltransferase domain-containing protein [Polyangia bacterium]